MVGTATFPSNEIRSVISLSSTSASQTILAIAIRRCKAERAKHMPRHNEAEKSGGDDRKDHERDDVLHSASPNTPKRVFSYFLSGS
jgi:hypothetical protein